MTPNEVDTVSIVQELERLLPEVDKDRLETVALAIMAEIIRNKK